MCECAASNCQVKCNCFSEFYALALFGEDRPVLLCIYREGSLHAYTCGFISEQFLANVAELLSD